jgi:pantetheine-phosphate adenylyltransferase
MTAIFPGTFDPITVGHADLIRRILPMFSQVTIAVGINSRKQTLFDPQQRMQWIETVFAGEKKVVVKSYEGLTINFASGNNAQVIVRGLRSASDFEYERDIAQLNRNLQADIETVFILSHPSYSHISSTLVREIIIHRGAIEKLVPEVIVASVRKAYQDLRS